MFASKAELARTGGQGIAVSNSHVKSLAIYEEPSNLWRAQPAAERLPQIKSGSFVKQGSSPQNAEK
eukprot:1161464-Pelagomonas_calceolata.AAC.10